MEIIDNSKHIIGKINSERSTKDKRLRAEVDRQLRDYKKVLAAEYKQDADQLKEDHDLKIESMQVRLQGAHDLIQEQKTLEVESENIDHVLKTVASSVQTLAKKDKQKIVKAMLAHIQDKRVKTYHIPKDVVVKGAKSTLKDFAVIGVISKNEELEYTLQDLMQEHEVMIRKNVGNAK